MAGRNHPYSRSPPRARASVVDDPRLLQAHPVRARQVALFEAQQRDIQALVHDNQRLAATHVALKLELSAADQDIRHLSSTAANAKAETDALVREVYERSLQTEAELRSNGELASELAQVKSDIQRMIADRKELSSKLQEINEELVLVRAKLEPMSSVEAELELMQKEMKRGRAAIQYEEKMQAINNEQSEIMEKHRAEMAREIEKLRAELANAEKRARAAAAAAAAPGPGYSVAYSNPEAGYAGAMYVNHYHAPQVHGGVDGNLQYGAEVPNGPQDAAGPYSLFMHAVYCNLRLGESLASHVIIPNVQFP